MIFEPFEASAPPEIVLSAEDSLQWEFPGSAVAIPYPAFKDARFQHELAAFLEQANAEVVKRFLPDVKTAGVDVKEDRPAAQPHLITQFLVALLASNGSLVKTPVLKKRVRDEAYHETKGHLLWTRSSSWLIHRVAVHRQLCMDIGDPLGTFAYKLLVAIVAAQLLGESAGSIDPGYVNFLRAKLCRRLSKLESYIARFAPSVYTKSFENALETLTPFFEHNINLATSAITQPWDCLKKSSVRKIPLFPRNAEQSDFDLKLPKSGKHLDNILELQRSNDLGQGSNDRDDSDPFETDEARYCSGLMKRYVVPFDNLAQKEDPNYLKALSNNLDAERRCSRYADTVVEYMEQAFECYKDNSEQLSHMILITMELWVEMDKAALETYPLLRNYLPPFRSEILNALELPTHEQLLRLKQIEDYLRLRRRQAVISCDIFAEPSNECFAAQFFNQSSSCQKLRARIESEALASKNQKLAALEQLNNEYRDLSSKMTNSQCSRAKHWRYEWCPRCSYASDRNRLSQLGVWVFEHPLPSDMAALKTVIFELDIKESFMKYRDSTWTIISKLCYSEKGVRDVREEDTRSLAGYSGLQSVNPLMGRISLASKMKSFYVTPHKHVEIPNDSVNVVLPHRMKYSYFDSDTAIFPKRLKNPSLEHLCRLRLPSSSPFFKVLESREFKKNVQSSYATIASQSQCPRNINVHEHFAYQNLFFGKSLRWPNILKEIGSSTLNFSYEAIMLSIQHLAWEAGPEVEGSSHRLMHFVFTDVKFCKKLLEQTSRRVATLEENYREGFNMELLLTLLLRLFSLGPSVLKSETLEEIHRVRAITEHWMRLLREKVQSTSETDVIEICSAYALRAALLCRATFVPNENDGKEVFDKGELATLLKATIVMQENMVRPSEQDESWKRPIIRDVKMSFQLRNKIHGSVRRRRDAVIDAIHNVWLDNPNAPRIYISHCLLKGRQRDWVRLDVEATPFTNGATVILHVLQGHLLINGRTLGIAPPQIRDDPNVRMLLPQRRLYTLPSSLPGMSYALSGTEKDHHIHFGFRDDEVIIRAVFRERTLEFIPSIVFDKSDLPSPLIKDCVHWLDVGGGKLYIRESCSKWEPSKTNWIIDIFEREGYFQDLILVDVGTKIFKSIAKIFEGFESPDQIMVLESSDGLRVHLKRYQLEFSVKDNGLLYSNKLRSEVDPNQDAGTFYGLKSMIVFREPQGAMRRTIIVPKATPEVKRHSIHVETIIKSFRSQCNSGSTKSWAV